MIWYGNKAGLVEWLIELSQSVEKEEYIYKQSYIENVTSVVVEIE